MKHFPACVDCKHIRRPNPRLGKSVIFSKCAVSLTPRCPVSGVASMRYCVDARRSQSMEDYSYLGNCGPSGSYFEPRPEPVPIRVAIRNWFRSLFNAF